MVSTSSFSLQALVRQATSALNKAMPSPHRLEATIVLAGATRVRALNKTYRGKDKPTDVLSFPQLTRTQIARHLRAPKKNKALYLGDVLLCLPVMRTGARAREKPLKHHAIHLIVHGVLHLLGYDHMKLRGVAAMEKLEKSILADLGIPDPYTERHTPPRRAKRNTVSRHEH